MYYYENYQSYGDLGIYQNETCLIYKSPIVEKINNLCPFFRDYVSKTKDNMSTSISTLQNSLNLSQNRPQVRVAVQVPHLHLTAPRKS